MPEITCLRLPATCPITNLEHADMAYEWEFCGVNDFHRANMKMDEGGRPVFTPVDGEMTKDRSIVSAEEKANVSGICKQAWIEG